LVGREKFVWSFGFFALKMIPLKEDIAIQFFGQHICKDFVKNAIIDRRPRSDVSEI